MQAKEIMTRDPKCVTPDTNVRDVVQMMRDEDVGLIPVVESDSSRRLIGVVTDRDIALRVVGEGKDGGTTVRSVMSERVHTARETDDVEAVTRIMGQEQVRRVPIVDERGGLIGIIAQADVALEDVSSRRVDRTLEKISKPNG